MEQKKKSIEKGLLIFIDAFCVAVSLIIAFYMRYGSFVKAESEADPLWMLGVMIFLMIFSGTVFDFYHHFFRRGVLEELVAVIKAQMIFSVIWVVFLYLLHQSNDLSRLVFIYFFFTNIVLTNISHLFFKQYMIKVYKKS